MGKITFLAVGSRGDLNPACILGQALKDEGYRVCIATHDRFRDFVLNLGLEFFTIAGDYQELLNSEAGLDFLEGKGGFRLIDDALLLQQLEDSYAACKGSDLIIAFPLSFFADQPAWGKTLQNLGIVPSPIPIKELTAEKLSEAIDIAVTNPDMKAKAIKIAADLESENGVKSATKVVQKYLPI